MQTWAFEARWFGSIPDGGTMEQLLYLSIADRKGPGDVWTDTRGWVGEVDKQYTITKIIHTPMPEDPDLWDGWEVWGIPSPVDTDS